MGCRERTRGAISIPGERPAGVWTAGVAQSYINLQNKMVGTGGCDPGFRRYRNDHGKENDSGGGSCAGLCLRFSLMQADFPEILRQCLRDYDIPLYLSHTVTDILGKDRLEGVVVSQVDEKLQPVPGTEKNAPL